jgi:tRNA U34 2-thiouridine synthase MnmA/TrmU
MSNKNKSKKEEAVAGGENENLEKQTLANGENSQNSQENKIFDCQIQVRYHQEIQNCQVEILPNGDALVTFQKPVKAVAVGQSAVFYDGEFLLGGGIIDEILE